jgi:hypothetical protein
VLLVATPLGVAGGLYEGYRLTGGLVFLMAALLGFIAVAIAMVAATIRRERAAEIAATARPPSDSPRDPAEPRP